MNRTRTNAKNFSTARTVALLAACVLLAFGAGCGSEEGTTPDCVQDVNADGHQTPANGCNPFAPCVIGGQAKPATECCKNVGNGDPLSYDYQACLYGYGAGPEPGTK
jgi:hypothetical protein